MTKRDTPLDAWDKVLSSLRSNRSPLRALGVLALLDAAERGRVVDGLLSWSDFQVSFASVAPPQHLAKAWMPFFHLSGRAGLWTLWLDDEKANFLDLPKRKPTSAASLGRRANSALMESELVQGTSSSAHRDALKHALVQLIDGV